MVPYNSKWHPGSLIQDYPSYKGLRGIISYSMRGSQVQDRFFAHNWRPEG